MTTKLEKKARELNDVYRDKLAHAVRVRFGLEIETHYALFADRLITTRADGEDFTPEQMAYMYAFEEGWLAAADVVRQP